MPTINQVNYPCLAYQEMEVKWELISDLLGGTLRMREAGEKWLPKETKEKITAYDNRRKRSILFNAFRDSCDKLVSKPFSSALSSQGTMPPKLAPLMDDADLQGTSASEFFKSVMKTGVHYGVSHVLVDYPAVPPTLNLAEETQLKVRPYFVHITPQNLVGWKSERGANGVEALIEVRILEQRVEQTGDYGEKAVNYLRKYTTKDWTLYKEDDTKAEDDEGRWTIFQGPILHTFGRVPMQSYYIQRTGLCQADPPLEDLAWLNLAHWQSQSDQRNILRFARVGILFMAGVPEEEMEKEQSIGPSQVIRSTNPDAKCMYVEHTGRAIEAGANDLKSLEEKMQIMGLTPFIVKSANSTATSQRIDESRSHADIFSWIRDLEDLIKDCFSMAAEWVGGTLPEDLEFDIFDDFTVGSTAQDDANLLIKMFQMGLITAETCLEEVKRRGLLSENLDVEEELGNVKAAGPSLALLSAMPAPPAGGPGGPPAKPAEKAPPKPVAKAS